MNTLQEASIDSMFFYYLRIMDYHVSLVILYPYDITTFYLFSYEMFQFQRQYDKFIISFCNVISLICYSLSIDPIQLSLVSHIDQQYTLNNGRI